MLQKMGGGISSKINYKVIRKKILFVVKKTTKQMVGGDFTHIAKNGD